MTIPTLAEFAKEFTAVYVAVNNKPSEQETKESIIRVHLLPAFGDLRLDEIDVRRLDTFKAKQLASGLKAKTINNHLMVLSKMLSLAQEWELITKLPKIRPLKAAPAGFDFLTFEEADRLLAAASDRWRPMILLALRTGCRRGELVALQREDFDLANGRLNVRRNYVRGHIGTPKSNKGREIPLSAKTVETFKPIVDALEPGALVFPGKNGKPLDSSSTRWPLWSACRKAGLGRKIGWHCLRHTFASHLTMRGQPMKVVQELLGHFSVTITMRYSHLSPNVHKDAVNALD